jgi:hypothetical protein
MDGTSELTSVSQKEWGLRQCLPVVPLPCISAFQVWMFGVPGEGADRLEQQQHPPVRKPNPAQKECDTLWNGNRYRRLLSSSWPFDRDTGMPVASCILNESWPCVYIPAHWRLLASLQVPYHSSPHEAGLLRILPTRLRYLATLVLSMQLTFLFALLPLLAGVAQADTSDLGLDIRVVKDNSKRGSDDGVVRRAGESVVNSYTQCEQVCVSRLVGKPLNER